jgi:molybdopterin synthase catalytic subunit/molybdopterin converting factor small subunit
MSSEKHCLTISFHAAARDLAETRETTLAENSVQSILELQAHLASEYPRLAPYLDRMRYAVNDEFVSDDARLGSGDRVDVMPPVAGGSTRVRATIREESLSLDEVVAHVSHSGAGAVATFMGVVRDHAEGKAVSRLDYEAQLKLATKEMIRVLEAICDEVGEVRISAIHRVGRLRVGDVAVVVAASAAHRAEAFQACRLAIDRIKETVPIWKREWDAEGTPNWVGLEPQ